MRLKDKVAIVTGAGKGIGRWIAVEYARQGAKVMIATRSLEPGQETLAIIEKEGGEAFVSQVDVAKEADAERMVREVLERWGRLDILVNNAGISLEGDMTSIKSITELSTDTWDRVMGVNLRGVFLCCRAAIPAMMEAGGGSIINVGSTAGMRAARGGLTYTATKHGLIGFTKQLAWVCGPHGIRVNTLSPGAVETDMMTTVIANPDHPSVARVKASPAGWYGKADVCAGAAVYLASDESKFVYGINLPVDGGTSL